MEETASRTHKKMYSFWIKYMILLEVWQEGGRNGYKYRHILKNGGRKLMIHTGWP